MINWQDNIGELGDEDVDVVEPRVLWGGLDKVLCERFGERLKNVKEMDGARRLKLD